MDINRIHYFSVLAETKHVRKAAEILKINPASLSKAIKVLEAEVGFKLVVANGRGIQITDGGLQFCRKSRKLLREFFDLTQALGKEQREPNPVVRLGSMEVFTTYFLSRFLADQSQEVRMSTRYLTPGKIEDSLQHGEIDIGITYVQLPKTDLQYIKVGEFRMRIFGTKEMLKRRFEDLPFVVPIDGIRAPGVYVRALDHWPEERFPRQITYEFELLESALQVCKIGRAVVFCPDFVVKIMNEQVSEKWRLREIPFPANFRSPALPVYLVTRRNYEEDSVIRRLARLVRSFS